LSQGFSSALKRDDIKKIGINLARIDGSITGRDKKGAFEELEN